MGSILSSRAGATSPFRRVIEIAPVPDPDHARNRIILKADIPNPIDVPSGCVFRPGRRYALPDCAAAVPPLTEVAPGHVKACLREDIP